MKERLSKLLSVKSIVTFVVIAIFAILALRGDIAADNVMYIVTTVIAFYFGTQHERKSGGVEQ
jgi:5-bromo-4-chloroindolyl phosphate hydrolysis protein